VLCGSFGALFGNDPFSAPFFAPPETLRAGAYMLKRLSISLDGDGTFFLGLGAAAGEALDTETSLEPSAAPFPTPLALTPARSKCDDGRGDCAAAAYTTGVFFGEFRLCDSAPRPCTFGELFDDSPDSNEPNPDFRINPAT
jgi:hypothetical protein